MRVIILKNINPGWNVGDEVVIEDMIWLKTLIADEAVKCLEAMPEENGPKVRPVAKKRK